MARSSSPAPTRCAALKSSRPGSQLLKLPLFAVGEHTAAAASAAGFDKVISADGDAAALRESVLASVKAKAVEEGQHAVVSGRRGSGARSRRRARRTRFYCCHPNHLPDGPGVRACRAMPATASPPTGSRRCCITRGAARARSWRRRVPPASKSRRWRSRNAAFPTRSPPLSATPGPPRSWPPGRRMKMPYSSCWTVLCAPDRAKRERFAPNDPPTYRQCFGPLPTKEPP